MKRIATTLALLGALTIGLNAADKAEKSIYDTAASNKMFSTLTAAVNAADKKQMLDEDKGPFTVFAPTDEAFEKLPAGTVEDLLKPENKEKLAAILAYHVVPSKVMAADVKTMKAPTANGAELDVKVDGDKVTVNGAKVVKTDIAASNGVIHVIDTVLMPPAE